MIFPPAQVPLLLYEDFLDKIFADYCFTQLLAQQQWPHNRYEVFGRHFTLPRQQTWHADPGIVYSYSNNLLQSRPWTDLLSQLRARVEAFTALPFNAVLVNLYRNGEDFVGWHSDDEIEMGSQPVIASLSLGATREFSFRTKPNEHSLQTQNSIQLSAGSLLVMAPEFQHQWQHAVLPCDEIKPRINLTFRHVLEPA